MELDIYAMKSTELEKYYMMLDANVPNAVLELKPDWEY